MPWEKATMPDQIASARKGATHCRQPRTHHPPGRSSPRVSSLENSPDSLLCAEEQQ